MSAPVYESPGSHADDASWVSVLTDEERAEMAAKREQAAIDGGACEMGPDGKPLSVRWSR